MRAAPTATAATNHPVASRKRRSATPGCLGSGWQTACALSIAIAASCSAPPLNAQASDPTALTALRAAVSAELNAAKTDRSAWDYRDHDVEPGKDAVYHVIETPKGNLKRLLILDGHPLTGADEADELNHMRDFVDSPGEQAHRRKAADADGAQAEELLNMLPNAFLWTVASQTPSTIALRFKPNPDFHPPDMQSRVLGIMAGDLVIARDGNRIQTLRGTLTDDVRIGFGLLGKIEKGGTFDVERRQLAPGLWQINETHVHIGGHALLFKTIGQQQDEVKSDWRPSTAPDLPAALNQLEHDRP